MSYITYSPNQVVYIRGIGYATLVNCGARTTLSQKIEAQPQKKESIYFDPDLFNSDVDSNHSKKSQSKSDEDKLEKKLSEVIAEKNTKDEVLTEKKEESEKIVVQEVINIVQAKIDGGTMVYTSDKELTKTIFISVKSFLVTRRDQITIEMEITKNIDTLRKQIFSQMGEQISNYYNIKLFATNPVLGELNVHSKTIAQCLIKENDKLILTADFAFGFRTVPAQLNIKHKITLANGVTLTSTKPPEQLKKADEKVAIPLPPPPTQPLSQETKPEQPQQKPAELPVVEKAVELPKVQQPAAQPSTVIVPVTIPQIDEKLLLQNGPYHARCNVEWGSGKKYWQIKVEKIPVDEDDLVIGVCIASEGKQATGGWNCDHLWGYQPSVGKKIHYQRDRETGHFDDEFEGYGYMIRPNDTIGVLLIFKGKRVSLTFYKNSISCGEAFLIDLEGLKVANRTLIPFVNIGGEAQVTLDSKAQLPLDSFRLK